MLSTFKSETFVHASSVMDLRAWGPDRDWSKPIDPQEAQRFCKALALTHYENFSVVAWMVPAPLRQDMFNIYAYCRWSDDLADELGSSGESLRHLEWWEGQLNRIPNEEPQHPVMVALRGTVRRHALDLQPFHDLLSAFRQDQMVARYQDDQHVLDYCRRSANPVGRILLQLADTRDDNCISWSDSICTGLQIANFCQDMARDASNHRVYLPQSRWAEAAVEESEFFSGQASPGKLRALEAWCSLANQYLRSGWPLQTQVPAWLARGVRVFVGGGLAILENIAQQGFDVWTHRPVVSRLQKLRILVRACFLGRIPQPRAHTYRKGISNYPISTNDSEKGISQT